MYVMPMNKQVAAQILKWTYPKPYDFYNNELTDRALAEFLNNTYHAILDDHDNVVGFFCIGESAQVPIGALFGVYHEVRLDIGLGMKPDLSGQGFGFTFFSFVLDSIFQKAGNVPLRLTVAEFNTRAFHLYEKLGFVKQAEFLSGDIKFITMVKE